MDPGEGGKSDGVGRKGEEDPLWCMTLDPGREGVDLLDNGFHPSPLLGRVARRSIWPQQRFLIDHAQGVVSQDTQGQDEILVAPRRFMWVTSDPAYPGSGRPC